MMSVLRGHPGAQARPDGATVEIRLELVVCALVFFILAYFVRSDRKLRRQRCCVACRTACITLWLISLLYSVCVLDLAVETDQNGATWLVVYLTPGPAGQLHYIGEAVSISFHLCLAAAGFVLFTHWRSPSSIRTVLCAVMLGMLCSLVLIQPIMLNPRPSPIRQRVLEFDLNSRMGNNLIQWLFASIDAERFGYRLRSQVASHRGWYRSYRAKVLLGFPNIREDSYGRLGDIRGFAWWMDRARGLADAQRVSCSDDEYKQNYFFFQHHRPLARRLWQSARPHRLRIGDDDIAVHFRVLEVNYSYTDPDTYVPPYAYFETSVNSSWRPGRRVWILVEASQREHETVKRLQHTFGAQVYGGDEKEDWVAGTQAKVFIGSQGTFSWTIAYVSEVASRIHLPFVGYLAQGSTWLPWCDLFIHDDTRILYSDVKHPRVALTARHVMDDQTPFTDCIARRSPPPCFAKHGQRVNI